MAQPGLPADLLERLSGMVSAQLGLSFPKARWRDLERGLAAACKDLGHSDPKACANTLLTGAFSATQVEVLTGYLTIGETHFFRDADLFLVLRSQLLPELVGQAQREDRVLRIWSAGCSSGEEPYSIAILLDQMGVPDARVELLATDINAKALAKADEGLYTQWSFRGTPEWVKQRYFKPSGSQHFELLPEIRRKVTFAPLNLAQDVFPSLRNGTSGLDLILCRHVLMYFDTQLADKIVERFGRCLVEGGRLALGGVEVAHVHPRGFAVEKIRQTVFFRKVSTFTGAESVSAPFSHAPARPVVFPPASFGAGLWPNKFPSVPRPSQPSSVMPALGASQAALAATLQAARELYARGEYEAVVEALQKAWAEKRQNAESSAETWILAAHASANLGDMPGALLWCERALASEPTNPAYHYVAGSVLFHMHRDQEASGAFSRTLYLAPEHVLARFGLAQIARRQGQKAEEHRELMRIRDLLDACPANEILPDSDGVTCGTFARLIEGVLREVSLDE